MYKRQVQVLRDTMRKIPRWVDAVTRSQVEVELVRVAATNGHQALREAAALRLLLLDQDGPEPDLEERDRRRGARVGEHGSDLMTEFRATLTPELAALFGVLFAKFAAPGMCNPADPEPCTCGTPTQAQIDADDRTLAQRQHDALVVVGRIALSTDLGTLNGLPVSILIRTTVQDLESRGIAITGDGTLMTMGDLDRLGGHAAYHLCVFDGKTGSALNHFRSKRVATPAQRIMAIAKYGGCSKPGCTVGAYGVQMHHAVADWADDGLTNIDDLAPACGGDNRLVGPGGYTTTVNDQCDCEWIPPAHLDTGQTRINILHRPDLLLTPTDHDEDQDEETVAAESVDAENDAPPTEPDASAEIDEIDAIPDPLDPDYLFGPSDDAPEIPRPRKWTDAEHAAFEKRYPNGPFADYPDDPIVTDIPPMPRPRTWTDAEHAAFERHYPNGPFADYPDENADTDTYPFSGPAFPHDFIRFNATGLFSTSQATQTRTRNELRQLLTRCIAAKPKHHTNTHQPGAPPR